MNHFKGKIAIVTGAGSGIGAALSRELGHRGTQVVCSDVAGEAGRAARTD